MFECYVCGGTEAHEAYVSEVFVVDGRRVLIEKIPAQVCGRCGEATFSRATTERVRKMVHGKAEPISVVEENNDGELARLEAWLVRRDALAERILAERGGKPLDHDTILEEAKHNLEERHVLFSVDGKFGV